MASVRQVALAVRQVAPLLALVAGCVTPPGPQKSADAAAPPKGTACQVVPIWNNQVAFIPDPTQRGAPAPGLAGRIYLFGQELGTPMTTDGTLVVELYDETPPPEQRRRAADGRPLPLEVWQFDKDTLKRLLCKDAFGWGYTVFLPWANYRPDIMQVRLRTCYTTPQGIPLYSEGDPLALSSGGETGQITVTQSVVKPPMAGPAQ
jgi:hypothetical protein